MPNSMRFGSGQLVKRAVGVAAGVALAAAMGGVVPAQASTSGSTNGCFAWWQDHNSDAHCQPATANGYYRLAGNCDWQPGYIGNWVYFRSGAWSDGWQAFSCVGSVTSAGIEFTG